MTDGASLLNRGLTAHQAGDLPGALALYRQVLAQDRANADAIHLIGVIAYQTGDPLTAINVIGRAIAIDDRNPAYHSNLGEALRVTGALDQAAASHARAIDLDPGFIDAHRNLGVVELARGNAQAAADSFRRALARDAASAPSWHGLGLALEALGRASEAMEAFAACLRHEPGHTDARQRHDALSASVAAESPEVSPTASLAAPPTDWQDLLLADVRAQCRNPGGPERLAVIGQLCDTLLNGQSALPRRLLDALEEDPLCGDPILDASVQFRLSGDLYHYERLIHTVIGNGADWPLDVAQAVYWSISRQIFLGRPLGTRLAAFTAGDLPRFYRWILREVKRRFAVAPKPFTVRAGEPRRIAIVTNQFTRPMHQPSRDAFDYARRLQDAFGCAVLLVNGNLLPSAVLTAFVPPFQAVVTPGLAGPVAVSEDGATVRTWSSVERSLSEAKIRGLVETIEGFDPDLVVSFGGSVLAADLFAGVRPTICIPTTSGLTCSMADILLSFDDGDPTAGLPEEYRASFAERLRPFRFGYSAPPEAPGARRAAFGLPDDAFVFTVVGGRLDEEVTSAFIERLDALLDLCPNALVAFAGPVATLPGRLASARNAGRLRSLGFVPEIRALYHVADAYLNPPRQGGGGSAAYALADGLPVVTLNQGDVAAVVGPSRAASQWDAFTERARRLAHDPAFRRGESEEARRLFAGIDARHAAVERLLAYGRALMQRFAAR
ncbi:tetratricopeptide repeat protein [Azospirillum agricola]|uniref:tetratricopeptide repeat-containing glycosyltransferase family protein n=1 Tax=Azospirillum agricola TaxID=1720247 RepID=UPI000A0EF64E|nr:tetratricopeptide repeat-containing glycosyltransferase family protein [Azospirillum agricola]SMH45344.1 TPR repeat-containing protein [Azospirillum lipoferum]